MNTLTLDPRIYEFENQAASDSYTQWLEGEVQKSKASPVISNEQAMDRLDANRAKLLERMKNAG